MRNFALLVAMILFGANAFAQKTGTWQTDKRTFTNVDSIHWFTDQGAQFPGGQDALMKYLGSNIMYPEAAQKEKIEGKVIARMVVHSNGKISDIEILTGLGYGCDEEVLRVLKAMPDWKPGIIKGQKVACYFLFPVTFSLDGKDPEQD